MVNARHSRIPNFSSVSFISAVTHLPVLELNSEPTLPSSKKNILTGDFTDPIMRVISWYHKEETRVCSLGRQRQYFQQARHPSINSYRTEGAHGRHATPDSKKRPGCKNYSNPIHTLPELKSSDSVTLHCQDTPCKLQLPMQPGFKLGQEALKWHH